MDSQIKLNGDRPKSPTATNVPQAMSTPSSSAQAAEEKTGPRTPKEKAKEFLSGMTYVIHPKLGRRLPRVWALPTLSYSAFPFAPFPSRLFPHASVGGRIPVPGHACVCTLPWYRPAVASVALYFSDEFPRGGSVFPTLFPTSVVPCRVSVPLICTRVCAHLRPL